MSVLIRLKLKFVILTGAVFVNILSSKNVILPEINSLQASKRFIF
jgi:hypothetical protein